MAHNFGEGHRTSQGRIPDPPQAPPSEVLPHAPTPYFQYKTNPLCWDLIDGPDGPEWLPRLSKLRHEPGVGGVDKTGNIDQAVFDAEKRGWIVLKNLAPAEYIRAHNCRGGTYHCERWETPQHMGDKILDPIIDTEGYNDFRRSLIRDGRIPPPSPSVVDQVQVEQQRKRYQHVLRDKNASDEIRATERLRLEKMEKATESLSEPKKTGGKKADA